MSSDHTPPDFSIRRRSDRRSSPGGSPYGLSRLALRLVGLLVIAVAGVFLYRGIRARFVLPECDSDRAKQTLAQVLKELKLEPVRYAPIKTVSSTKDKVVCNAVMPLPDGANVVADYTFYWQGSKADMRYSVSRQPARSSSLGESRKARVAS